MNTKDTFKALDRVKKIVRRIDDLQEEKTQIIASLTNGSNGVTDGRRKGHRQSSASKAKLARVAKARWNKIKAAGRTKL